MGDKSPRQRGSETSSTWQKIKDSLQRLVDIAGARAAEQPAMARFRPPPTTPKRKQWALCIRCGIANIAWSTCKCKYMYAIARCNGFEFAAGARGVEVTTVGAAASEARAALS